MNEHFHSENIQYKQPHRENLSQCNEFDYPDDIDREFLDQLAAELLERNKYTYLSEMLNRLLQWFEDSRNSNLSYEVEMKIKIMLMRKLTGRDLSQAQIARESGVSPETVSNRWEKTKKLFEQKSI